MQERIDARAAARNAEPCREFKRNGTCRRGSSCCFVHVSHGDETSASGDADVLVADAIPGGASLLAGGATMGNADPLAGGAALFDF